MAVRPYRVNQYMQQFTWSIARCKMESPARLFQGHCMEYRRDMEESRRSLPSQIPAMPPDWPGNARLVPRSCFARAIPI
jgi:hypothetical protein